MAWYAWLMILVFSINTFLTIVYIGDKREPITPVSAAITVVLNALFIWGVVSLAA